MALYVTPGFLSCLFCDQHGLSLQRARPSASHYVGLQVIEERERRLTNEIKYLKSAL